MAARYMLSNSYVFEADLLLSNPAIIKKYHYTSDFLGIKKTRTDDRCVIVYELDFSYAGLVEKYFADLSEYDQSIYFDECKVKSNRYLCDDRNGCAIVINSKLLNAKGLQEPESYEDLLKPEFKGLVSMPNPKSAGTGYAFIKSLVNA